MIAKQSDEPNKLPPNADRCTDTGRINIVDNSAVIFGSGRRNPPFVLNQIAAVLLWKKINFTGHQSWQQQKP